MALVTYPTMSEFNGVPVAYQHAHWVSDPRYQGGGYWSGTGLGFHYDIAQLERLWLDAGGPANAAPYMASIAENTESGGDAGDWNSTGATGLWQIEWPLNYGGRRSKLFVPIVNARTAVKMYESSGFSPWKGDPLTNPGIPPAPPGTVPHEGQAMAGGGGKGGNTVISATNATTTSFHIPNPFNLLNPKSFFNADLLQRLGLIVLGGSLILIGVWMLAGQKTFKLTTSVLAPEATAAGKAASSRASNKERTADQGSDAE